MGSIMQNPTAAVFKAELFLQDKYMVTYYQSESLELVYLLAFCKECLENFETKEALSLLAKQGNTHPTDKEFLDKLDEVDCTEAVIDHINCKTKVDYIHQQLQNFGRFTADITSLAPAANCCDYPFSRVIFSRIDKDINN